MVYQCLYCGKRTEPGVRILKPFPIDNPELLKSWLEKLDMGPKFVPTKSSKLCTDHFTKDCVDLKERKFALAPGSIPSLFGKRVWKFCFCCGAKAKDSVYRTFHSLPFRNDQRLRDWLASMRSKGFLPTKESLICADHFEDYCFENNERKTYRLKSSAVPTIFKPRQPKEFPVRIVKMLYDTEVPPPLIPFNNIQQPPAEMILPNAARLDFSSEIEISEKITTDHQSKEDSVPLSEACPSNIFDKDVKMSNSTKKEKKLLQDIFLHVKHDHLYCASVKALQKKLFKQEEKIKRLKNENRVKTQRIGRLLKRISNMKQEFQTHSLPKDIPDFEQDKVLYCK